MPIHFCCEFKIRKLRVKAYDLVDGAQVWNDVMEMNVNSATRRENNRSWRSKYISMVVVHVIKNIPSVPKEWNIVVNSKSVEKLISSNNLSVLINVKVERNSAWFLNLDMIVRIFNFEVLFAIFNRYSSCGNELL